MTIIEQIKVEIERLKSNMDDRDPLAPNQKAGYLFALADVLSFLSTIESEKPMNQDGLQEEIREYMSNEDNNPFDWDWRDKRDCARHFAEWGAEHLADARKTPRIL